VMRTALECAHKGWGESLKSVQLVAVAKCSCF